jgi:hypothetical protein
MTSHSDIGLVEDIRIDGLVGPLRWIKWADSALVIVFVLFARKDLSFAIKGDEDLWVFLAWTSWLAFPAWMAWINADVIQNIGRKYTILSLLLVAIPSVSVLTLVLLSKTTPTLHIDLDLDALFAMILLLFLIGSLTSLATIAVWKLRHRVVNSLGVKLIDMISMPPDHKTPKRPHKPKRPLIGWTLLASAVAMLVGPDFIPLPAELSGLSSVLTIVALGFGLMLMARVAFQPSAADLLKLDDRKPILLLRSFIDDERLNYLKAWISLFDASLEDRLARHFARLGPFVAISAPSEDEFALAPTVLGATRLRLSDAEWQDQVLRWIIDSNVILLMIGRTKWVRWELEQIIRNNALDRLVICFPPIKKLWWWEDLLFRREFKENTESRLARLKLTFSSTPWSSAIDQLDDAQTLRSLVLRDSGRVMAIRARSRNRNAYHLAIVIAHWVIKAAPLRPARAESPSQNRKVGMPIARTFFLPNP